MGSWEGGQLKEQVTHTHTHTHFIEVKNCKGDGNYSELFSELLRK
jgi:hypothetical protein